MTIICLCSYGIAQQEMKAISFYPNRNLATTYPLNATAKEIHRTRPAGNKCIYHSLLLKLLANLKSQDRPNARCMN